MKERTRDAASSPRSELTPFERFEDLTRRIVNVPRKEVPPVKHTPRPKPATVKPKRG